MAGIRFHKMHGLGNDFVVIDARADAAPTITPARARAIADRRLGIGCDQLIVLTAGDGRADATMRIWNADGSEAEACGNAARCVAALIGPARLATAGGTVAVAPDGAGDGAAVDLPPPRFGWDEVPLAYPLDTARLPVAWGPLASPAAVNVGNPHVVFTGLDPAAVDLASVGPAIETDPLFPARVNVSVATATGPGALTVRTWERGAGLTAACGTGACAAAVVAIRRGLVASPVAVAMAGGSVTVGWDGAGVIRLTGPATHVFTGDYDWADAA